MHYAHYCYLLSQKWTINVFPRFCKSAINESFRWRIGADRVLDANARFYWTKQTNPKGQTKRKINSQAIVMLCWIPEQRRVCQEDRAHSGKILYQFLCRHSVMSSQRMTCSLVYGLLWEWVKIWVVSSSPYQSKSIPKPLHRPFIERLSHCSVDTHYSSLHFHFTDILTV